jgi:hypothetical protein
MSDSGLPIVARRLREARERKVEEGNSESRGNCLQEIICEIQDLMKQSIMIDRNEFTRLLGEDFDGQYRKRK